MDEITREDLLAVKLKYGTVVKTNKNGGDRWPGSPDVMVPILDFLVTLPGDFLIEYGYMGNVGPTRNNEYTEYQLYNQLIEYDRKISNECFRG